MIGKVFIKNLKIPVKIGHLVHERHMPQTIRINVAVWADIGASIASNDLADTVDYVAVQKKILKLAEQKEYVLIETFANDILDACLADSHAQKAWVSIEKPHKFPESESVGIEVERSR